MALAAKCAAQQSLINLREEGRRCAEANKSESGQLRTEYEVKLFLCTVDTALQDGPAEGRESTRAVLGTLQGV